MNRNQAPGAESSRAARNQGRRKSAADTRIRAALFTARSCRRSARPARLARDFRPLLLPRAVIHAVVLPVSAFRHGRLPELDAVEVGARGIRVVDGARALLDFFHVRTG